MESKVLKDAEEDFLYTSYVSEDDSPVTESRKISPSLKKWSWSVQFRFLWTQGKLKLKTLHLWMRFLDGGDQNWLHFDSCGAQVPQKS